MTVIYKIDGKEYSVFLGLEANNVVVETKEMNVYRSIHSEINGRKYFTWNKRKVYIDSFKKQSMRQIANRIEAIKKQKKYIKRYNISVERITKIEPITVTDLSGAMIHDGVENVRFLVNKKSVYRVLEGFNRRVIDTYRIVLRLVDYEQSNSIEHNIDYFVDMLQDDRFEIKILPSVGDSGRNHSKEYFSALL